MGIYAPLVHAGVLHAVHGVLFVPGLFCKLQLFFVIMAAIITDHKPVVAFIGAGARHDFLTHPLTVFPPEQQVRFINHGFSFQCQ